jgi:hypothetical protein
MRPLAVLRAAIAETQTDKIRPPDYRKRAPPSTITGTLANVRAGSNERNRFMLRLAELAIVGVLIMVPSRALSLWARRNVER